MNLLSIDPGSEKHSYVIVDDQYNILEAGELQTEDMLEKIAENVADMVLIETLASYYQVFGNELIQTAIMAGRLYQKCKDLLVPCELITRKEYAQAIIGGRARGRINDTGLKKALELRFNKKFSKGSILDSSHKRAAYGLAVYYLDKVNIENKHGISKT